MVVGGIHDGPSSNFDFFVWSLQTGTILNMVSGHTAFHPSGGILASASWDESVQLWDLYKRDPSNEKLAHTSPVVALAFRPDGKMVCTATLSGSLHFGNLEGENIGLLYVTDGQKDITGGRKINDRNTANTNASSSYFTSVCYSADGRCVLAGGNSRFVCIYEVSHQILPKKFQVSYNRGWDGMLNELNSKLLGESRHGLHRRPLNLFPGRLFGPFRSHLNHRGGDTRIDPHQLRSKGLHESPRRGATIERILLGPNGV